MLTVKVLDRNETLIGTLSEAVVQLSNDRHAVGGGYIGGFFDELVPIEKGHYESLILRDESHFYHQCWLHAKATLLGKKHAVFSFTYYEGTPIENTSNTSSH